VKGDNKIKLEKPKTSPSGGVLGKLNPKKKIEIKEKRKTVHL